MKILKKLLLNLSICTAIAAMVASPVSAQSHSSNTVEPVSTIESTIDISNIKLGEKVVLPDGAVLTPISQQEYISKLATEKSISLQEAYNIESKGSNIQILSGNTYYYDYSKTFTYPDNPNFEADLQATLKMYSSGSFRQINDIIAVSSRRSAGVYSNEWIETDAYSDPDRGSSEFPVTSATIGAKGYFEVVSTVQLDLSIDLPGFSGGFGTGGNFIYQSDTLSMRSTYSVY